jgi:hypothetical protein
LIGSFIFSTLVALGWAAVWTLAVVYAGFAGPILLWGWQHPAAGRAQRVAAPA